MTITNIKKIFRMKEISFTETVKIYTLFAITLLVGIVVWQWTFISGFSSAFIHSGKDTAVCLSLVTSEGDLDSIDFCNHFDYTDTIYDISVLSIHYEDEFIKVKTRTDCIIPLNNDDWTILPFYNTYYFCPSNDGLRFIGK